MPTRQAQIDPTARGEALASSPSAVFSRSTHLLARFFEGSRGADWFLHKTGLSVFGSPTQSDQLLVGQIRKSPQKKGENLPRNRMAFGSHQQKTEGHLQPSRVKAKGLPGGTKATSSMACAGKQSWRYRNGPLWAVPRTPFYRNQGNSLDRSK